MRRKTERLLTDAMASLSANGASSTTLRQSVETTLALLRRLAPSPEECPTSEHDSSMGVWEIF